MNLLVDSTNFEELPKKRIVKKSNRIRVKRKPSPRKDVVQTENTPPRQEEISMRLTTEELN